MCIYICICLSDIYMSFLLSFFGLLDRKGHWFDRKDDLLTLLLEAEHDFLFVGTVRGLHSFLFVGTVCGLNGFLFVGTVVHGLRGFLFVGTVRGFNGPHACASCLWWWPSQYHTETQVINKVWVTCYPWINVTSSWETGFFPGGGRFFVCLFFVLFCFLLDSCCPGPRDYGGRHSSFSLKPKKLAVHLGSVPSQKQQPLCFTCSRILGAQIHLFLLFLHRENLLGWASFGVFCVI